MKLSYAGIRQALKFSLHGTLMGMLLLIALPSWAQESEKVWTFSPNNEAGGKPIPELAFHVPETDDIQLYATCGGEEAGSDIELTIAADIGSLVSSDSAKIRFSGGGKEFLLDGKVAIPAGGEGVYGARLLIPKDHPIWAAFDANENMSYLVPGYAASELNLKGGQEKIREFLDACRNPKAMEIADKTAPKDSSRSPQRQAFDAAKELNSIAAWQAFLRAYPKGFYSDLARAYLENPDDPQAEKTDTKPEETAKPENGTPKLDYFQAASGDLPWYNFTLSQDEGNASTFAAGVKADGLELLTYCTSDKKMALLLRETDQSYPKFNQRLEQGLQDQARIDFDFESVGIQQVAMQIYGLTGDVGTVDDLPGDGPVINSLIKGTTVLLDRPPFGANFQLDGSKYAICNVMKRCGVSNEACSGASTSAPTPTDTERKPVAQNNPKPNAGGSGRCPSGLVKFEGACMTKDQRRQARRDARRNKRKASCSGGQVNFRGQCMSKAERRSAISRRDGCIDGEVRFKGSCMTYRARRDICGPGFRPKGKDQCVRRK